MGKTWGGKRPGAGRKSKWRSPTKMVRLPEKFEAQLVAYAKLLDSGVQVKLVVLDEQK